MQKPTTGVGVRLREEIDEAVMQLSVLMEEAAGEVRPNRRAAFQARARVLLTTELMPAVLATGCAMFSTTERWSELINQLVQDLEQISDGLLQSEAPYLEKTSGVVDPIGALGASERLRVGDLRSNTRRVFAGTLAEFVDQQSFEATGLARGRQSSRELDAPPRRSEPTA